MHSCVCKRYAFSTIRETFTTSGILRFAASPFLEAAFVLNAELLYARSMQGPYAVERRIV